LYNSEIRKQIYARRNRSISSGYGNRYWSGKDKSYREEKKINRAHFVVEYDENYQEYVIIFPDLKTGEEGIPDNLLRISDEVKNAHQVLEKAVELAKIDLPTWESKNPDKDILKEIEKFIVEQKRFEEDLKRT